jgi:hypothetical protein
MKFTLEQLAHFDRCLFPDDFAEEIGKAAGYNDNEILFLKLSLRGRKLSVINIYQEWILDDQLCKALNSVLEDFCRKYWQ